MAKKIKAIKCPQCGSTDYRADMSSDRYECNNCRTVYFLDDDDINININHQYKNRKNKSIKWIVISIALFIFCMFGLVTCVGITIFKGNSNKTKTYTANIKEDIYYYFPQLFTSYKGNPYFVAVENRISQNSDKILSLVVKDLQTGKIVSREKLNDRNEYIHEAIFNDGSLYLIPYDENSLYKIDRESCQIQNVTNTIFRNHKELASGFSKIGFIYHNQGDGFTITSNRGEEFYYYPEMDKLLTKDQLRNYVPDPRAKEVILYEFYYEKYGNYQSDPKPLSLFEAKYKYDGIKKLISSKQLNPDRVFFKPKILYYDNDEILILCRADLKSDSPTLIQSLKVENQDINWTLSVDPKIELRPGYSVDAQINKAIKANDAYYVGGVGGAYYKISKEGKLQETVFYNKYN